MRMRKARGFEEWRQLLVLAEYIFAARPSFGKTSNRAVRLQQENPFREITARQYTLDPDQAERLLDSIAVEEQDPFA
jgi:hypothetical protein